ncbi:hypothetical protein BZM26_36600 [Paraburkholderia strydomiana]|nr:hypothetical protein BZM26_36600 [Paraburkholderia strydomiana]
MNTRWSTVALDADELANPDIATLYLECLDAEKRLRGARKVAASAVFLAREKHLESLWPRLEELDANLCAEFRLAIHGWHDLAVKLRGGE